MAGRPGEQRGTEPIPGHAEDFVGDPEAAARTLCLRQLEARARTRSELEQYLARKGVPAEPAQRVLDRFAEIGLIDDRALTEAYVETGHSHHGLARRGLAVKLRRRGVADTVVADAVGAIGGEREEVAARALVARRLRSLSGIGRAAKTRRLVGLLARKGYPSGLAYRVVRDLLEPDGEGDAVGGDADFSGSHED